MDDVGYLVAWMNGAPVDDIKTKNWKMKKSLPGLLRNAIVLAMARMSFLQLLDVSHSCSCL